MEFLLILVMAAFFALVHIFNGWLFQSFEMTPHVAWVYLPAFLRLFYVLVMGRLNGYIAIFLGGLLLASQYEGLNGLSILNNACSASAPVLACVGFEQWQRRRVNLSSLRDLLQFTVMYCVLNALLHHVMWALFDPSQWRDPLQVASMVTGDFLGCLIGVGLMKAAIDRFGLPQGLAKPPPQA